MFLFRYPEENGRTSLTPTAGGDDGPFDLEENLRRRTAMGGNSTPKRIFFVDASLVGLSALLVVNQRSCIFFSRRDIRSEEGLLVISSPVSIEFWSLVNLVQMSALAIENEGTLSLNTSSMATVVFESLLTFVDDPLSRAKEWINRSSSFYRCYSIRRTSTAYLHWREYSVLTANHRIPAPWFECCRRKNSESSRYYRTIQIHMIYNCQLLTAIAHRMWMMGTGTWIDEREKNARYHPIDQICSKERERERNRGVWDEWILVIIVCMM